MSKDRDFPKMSTHGPHKIPVVYEEVKNYSKRNGMDRAFDILFGEVLNTSWREFGEKSGKDTGTRD